MNLVILKVRRDLSAVQSGTVLTDITPVVAPLSCNRWISHNMKAKGLLEVLETETSQPVRVSKKKFFPLRCPLLGK